MTTKQQQSKITARCPNTTGHICWICATPFRIESATDHDSQKNAHGKQKTERKRMANKEFSTSFFLSKSVRKVPRVQNIKKKHGWCRGCQTVKKRRVFLILPFCWEVRACLSCNPGKRLCDGSQLMYFVCCSLKLPKSSSCRNSFPQNLKVPCVLLYQPRIVANTEFMASALSGR